MTRRPSSRALKLLVEEVKACRVCAAHLPQPPRPVLRVGASAPIVVIGQAPGSKVHESGIPWQDASGDHLLEWLEVDRPTFEDSSCFSIVPMGFCWPGRKAGGDLPPRSECAPLWHERILSQLSSEPLVLLVGQYAIAHYLKKDRAPSLTETVRNYANYLPRYFPLPHPSWRSRRWISQNPWFETDVLPALRQNIKQRLRLLGS